MLDIIGEIKYFYQTPEIDVITEESFIYLNIKYLSKISVKCEFLHKLVTGRRGEDRSGIQYIFDNKYINNLEQFIANLSINKDCLYVEGYHDYEGSIYFDVEIKGDTIIIDDTKIAIELNIESKNALLTAMKKYYDLIKNHADEFRRLNKINYKK